MPRLADPGELHDVRAASLPEEDVGERVALLVRRSFVDVEDDRPRRAGLVGVVSARKRDAQAAEIDAVGVPGVDTPAEEPEADAVRRASAHDAVHHAARTDRLAVARLEVRTGDAPAHRSISAIFSAIASTVRCVFARGTVGMIDASATYTFSKPFTRASRSTTEPIAHVPTGWK